MQVLDAVRAVLVGLSERTPVLLVVEDLHWADRATRELIGFLARALRSGRVTLAVSYRSDELHRRHPLRPLLAELVRLSTVERLELAPLTRAELTEHLEAVAGAPLPAEQVEGIYARSEGNPFYAEQLLAAGAGDARVELPATLAEALLARVQGLSESARRCWGWRRWRAAGCPTGCSPRLPGSPTPTWNRACTRRSAPGCWRPTPPPGVTRSAMRCCRRRSTATCCRVSRCACTPPTPACWPPAPTAPRPSWPTTAWPAMTWLARWPRRCGRPRRPRRSWPRPRPCAI